MTMMLIGVDPHKSTSTATAVEPESNREVASMRIEATLREYRGLLTWAGRWPERRWAIENAEGLGRHLASWLLARGEEGGRRRAHDRDRPGAAAVPRRGSEERPDRRRRGGVRGGIAG